tara:strand:- start:5883 stop:6248 length:366 start_codon:yes stop_codon:yes gene_type:complete
MLQEEYSIFLRTYNTVLRNIGIFITLSLATLAYSRYYRGKDKTSHSKIYNLGTILVSALFLSIAFTINNKLINDVKDMSENEISSKDIYKYDIWCKLPYLSMICILILFIFNIYTFVKFLF